MNDCLFCKIINGEIPSTKVYEDGEILAFKDIEPQSPIHFLIIPKTHISGADELETENAALIGKIMLTAQKLAKEYELDKGWRFVTNVGEDGRQSVKHLHFHLLGGAKLNARLG